jgi:hypothetical protein
LELKPHFLESIMNSQQVPDEEFPVAPARRVSDESRKIDGIEGKGEARGAARLVSDAESLEIDGVERKGEARGTTRQVQDDESRYVDRVERSIKAVATSQADDNVEEDYVQRRVAARKIAREIERKKKEAEEELNRHLMERALRARNRPTPVEVPPFLSRCYSGLLALIKSKVLYNVLIYSVLAVIVGEAGVYGYKLYQVQAAAAFRDHCLEKNLKYASGSRMYCYDDKRFAHQITDDGVTGRLKLDWTVNERQLALAVKAVERGARPVPRPFLADGVSVPEPIGVAAGTVAELAAQLLRDKDVPLIVKSAVPDTTSRRNLTLVPDPRPTISSAGG